MLQRARKLKSEIPPNALSTILSASSSEKDTKEAAKSTGSAKARGKIFVVAKPEELSAKLPSFPCAILLANDAESIIPSSEVKVVEMSQKSTDLPVGSPKSCLPS